MRSACFHADKDVVIPPLIAPVFLGAQGGTMPLASARSRNIHVSWRGPTTLERLNYPWYSILHLYGSFADQPWPQVTPGTYCPRCGGFAECVNQCSASVYTEVSRSVVYSNGVRQRMMSQYGGGRLPGWTLRSETYPTRSHSPTPAYVREMRRSIFCLCPLGHATWSSRIYESIASGCIPVIIGDYTLLPFSRFFDWSKFSVLVRESDISKLPFFIDLSPANVKKMQEELARVWRSFVYLKTSKERRMWLPSGGGGDAFYWAMRDLQEVAVQRGVIRAPLSFYASDNTVANGEIDLFAARSQRTELTDAWRLLLRKIASRKAGETPPVVLPDAMLFPVDDITLVSQMSADRLPILEQLTHVWRGPIAMAVFLDRKSVV